MCPGKLSDAITRSPFAEAQSHMTHGVTLGLQDERSEPSGKLRVIRVCSDNERYRR
jgi:hypothetical protein